MSEQVAILAAIVQWFKTEMHVVVYPHTSMHHDLRLHGFDADLFLHDFATHFGVNAEDLPYGRYFVGELGLGYLWYKWWKPERLERERLTVWMLSIWVTIGKWDSKRWCSLSSWTS